jgi:hypothetical protein
MIKLSLLYMPLEGFRDYRRREFCNDVQCPVQVRLNSLEQGSGEFQQAREECKQNCRHSTREFHYWLIDNGFLIVKQEERGE